MTQTAIQENRHTYRYTIHMEDGGITLKEYLKSRHLYSHRILTAIKKEGGLIVNGKEAFFQTILQDNDTVFVDLGIEKADSVPIEIAFDVIYEDDDVLLINKPPGLITHPTRHHQTDTLTNGIYHYWQKRGDKGKVRFVNRLDMGTSGVVLVAKNKYVHYFIQQQMTQRKVKKLYLAIAEGKFEKQQDTIDAPICRNEPDGILRGVNPIGKESLTSYKVLRYFPKQNVSLVQIELLTGRTHQIRVHMRHIGHPILGDELYDKKSTAIDRQALHAEAIGFSHPRSKRYETYCAPMWKDMQKILMKN